MTTPLTQEEYRDWKYMGFLDGDTIDRFAVTLDSLFADNTQLLTALEGLVAKPVPFCMESDRAVCPYCDSTEHPDDCEWLQAQHVWVGIKNRILIDKVKGLLPEERREEK